MLGKGSTRIVWSNNVMLVTRHSMVSSYKRHLFYSPAILSAKASKNSEGEYEQLIRGKKQTGSTKVYETLLTGKEYLLAIMLGIVWEKESEN